MTLRPELSILLLLLPLLVLSQSRGSRRRPNRVSISGDPQRRRKDHLSVNIPANEVDKSQRLHLDLISHKPCEWSKNNTKNGKWIEKIRFPSFTQAPLLPDLERPGCYRIGGTVWVKRRIQGTVQLHLELKHRVQKDRVPENCHNADPRTGCGGFGSCLYCEACDTVGDNAAVQLTRASLEVNGKKLDCDEGLERGVHKDVYLHFCLPTKNEFLKAQGISEDVWDQIVESRSGSKGKIGMFLYIRIFNSKINNLMLSQRKLEKYQRERLKLTDQDPLPNELFKQLPFNRLLEQEKGFIGCHRVFGNLYLKDE